MPAPDATTRFTSRVASYISSRPSYPASVATLVRDKFHLPPSAVIADIGSGTGILSRVLLDTLPGARVIGIEPNDAMRIAGDEWLAEYVAEGRFESGSGTAEGTELNKESVDVIVAGQAFHWFDVPKARAECNRVLRSGGGVALVWNDRRGMRQRGEDDLELETGKDEDFSGLDSPVMSAYDLLLVRRGIDYEKISHHKTVDAAALEAFFGPGGYKSARFANPYELNFETLKGRLLSSSYTPQEGEGGHEIMMKELKELFDDYQHDGVVDFLYDTRVFYGPIS